MKKKDLERQSGKGSARSVGEVCGSERRGEGSNGKALHGTDRDGSSRRVGACNGSRGTSRPGMASLGWPVSSKEQGADPAAPKFRVKDGARVRKEVAERIAPVMARLAAEGRGTAEELLREARSKRSPIHDCFEWDDTKAANEYRLEQARYYWRAITIEVETKDGGEPVRAFHPVFIDGQKRFTGIGTIVENVDLREQLLESAKRDLRAFAAKYSTLRKVAGFSSVFDAIDVVLEPPATAAE